MDDPHKTRTGILLAVGAILLWSTAPSSIVFGGTRLGPWQFLAMAGAVGGLALVIFYSRFLKMPLRKLLLPPPRVWPLAILGFPLYMSLFNNAMVMASGRQIGGVVLMNYLWPTLTVIFAVLWVPGTRASWQLAAAVAMSLTGLAVANWNEILEQLRSAPPAGPNGLSAWPYILAGLGAVAWAAYSALVARWRSWTCNYVTTPLGFLLVAALSAVVCAAHNLWVPMDATSWIAVVFCGLGPYAGGYMLWELSLHRAPAGTLGLLGSLSPVLGTAVLCALFAFWPDKAPPKSTYPLFLTGATLIAAAVLLGAYRPKK